MKFILITIALLLLAGCTTVESPDLGTVKPQDTKIYVSESPEECTLIKFMCAEDKVPFFDENGCGCEVDDSEESPEQFACTDPRPEACLANVDIACGWFDSSRIQCAKYPCAIEASNGCYACSNPDVAYYTKGPCPNP